MRWVRSPRRSQCGLRAAPSRRRHPFCRSGPCRRCRARSPATGSMSRVQALRHNVARAPQPCTGSTARHASIVARTSSTPILALQLPRCMNSARVCSSKMHDPVRIPVRGARASYLFSRGGRKRGIDEDAGIKADRRHRSCISSRVKAPTAAPQGRPCTITLIACSIAACRFGVSAAGDKGTITRRVFISKVRH